MSTPSVPRAPLPERAEVVVVGGGVMGTSIAFHLAEAGVRDVVVLEQDVLGSGSSAKPFGGVRATFSDPGNVLLGLRSLATFERFANRFSTDIGLRQVGYLFLCRSDAEVASVEASTALQQSLGASGRMITPTEAYALNPLIDPDVLVGASFSPRDGYAEPAKVVAAYALALEVLGGQVHEGTTVTGLDTSGGAVRAVRTDRGTIRTDAVVCAAGAWSARLGELAGVPLPVVPVRRQIGFSPHQAGPFPTVPFTLDLSTTLYFHNYPGGMLLGISNADEPEGFGRGFDHAWVPAFDEAARVVAPELVGRPLDGGWAGLYENTPDHNAIIGVSRRLDGFFYATGFSGHGFLQAPAVGEVVRDLYRGVEPFLDVTPFDVSRFDPDPVGRSLLAEVHII
ncbi:MAG: NAD(P)/FAD-dependent oxidoreductase [Janthinobacterium lividum]